MLIINGMDATEDRSGECQALENENQQVNQLIPGYENFHDYVQV